MRRHTNITFVAALATIPWVTGARAHAGEANRSPDSNTPQIELLMAYDVNRPSLKRRCGLDTMAKPPGRPDPSWSLVIETGGRAILWTDPVRPFDRIEHRIDPRRFEQLWRDVQAAGMSRFAHPRKGRETAPRALKRIRPDRIPAFPSGTEIAGVGPETYFTIGLGNRLSTSDPNRDTPTLKAVRRAMALITPVRDEVRRKGRAVKADYVILSTWDGSPSVGRGESGEMIRITDNWAMRWSSGMLAAPSVATALPAGEQARLQKQLVRVGLFDLKPAAKPPLREKNFYGTLCWVDARISGREITALATPAILEIFAPLRTRLHKLALSRKPATPPSAE